MFCCPVMPRWYKWRFIDHYDSGYLLTANLPTHETFGNNQEGGI